MARKFCLICLALVLQLSGCGSAGSLPADVADVTIFYLAFEGEVTPPVTIDTIETYKGTCRFTVLFRGKEAESLRRTLRMATTGGFDNNQVRVKAVGLLDEEVFIDKKGGVLFGRGGRQRQLLDSGLKSVEKVIGSVAKKRCQSPKPTIGGKANPAP
ncbi:MAG TPA: hypothetical protein VGH50_05340 [Candidatus Binatia bacterium]|jgi:hypothetical protein